jgi:hypothetical protein
VTTGSQEILLIQSLFDYVDIGMPGIDFPVATQPDGQTSLLHQEQNEIAEGNIRRLLDLIARSPSIPPGQLQLIEPQVNAYAEACIVKQQPSEMLACQLKQIVSNSVETKESTRLQIVKELDYSVFAASPKLLFKTGMLLNILGLNTPDELKKLAADVIYNIQPPDSKSPMLRVNKKLLLEKILMATTTALSAKTQKLQ